MWKDRMDRLEAMSLLIASVEAGSFSAASRKLRVPLPTLSRKVSELEALLNTKLLTRSTRKLTLTAAGAAYVAASKRILEQVGEAEAQAAGEFAAPRGELIVSGPMTFGRIHLLSIVNDFLLAFPEINVRMALSDRNMNLVDDHIDAAVRIGLLPDSGMIATSLGSVRRVVCGSPDYFKANGVPRTPDDLAGLTCVTFANLPAGSSWSFAAGGRNLTQFQRPRCRLNINTADAAIEAATAGIGVTHVLSYQVTKALERGLLSIVLTDFEPDPMPVHLVHAGQGLVPRKLRSFLEFAAPRLRKILVDDQKKLERGELRPSGYVRKVKAR
jgi:DNA-binding transcriptional LysR family regulator